MHSVDDLSPIPRFQMVNMVIIGLSLILLTKPGLRCSDGLHV